MSTPRNVAPWPTSTQATTNSGSAISPQRIFAPISRNISSKRSRSVFHKTRNGVVMVSMSTTPNDRQHLVAPPFHRRLVESFEVQAQQWLGVRATHIEMPAVVRNRNTVQVFELTITVTCGKFLHFGFAIRYRRVDFT